MISLDRKSSGSVGEAPIAVDLGDVSGYLVEMLADYYSLPIPQQLGSGNWRDVIFPGLDCSDVFEALDDSPFSTKKVLGFGFYYR